MGKVVVMNVCAKHPPYDGRVYQKISKTLLKCGYEVHNTSPNIDSGVTEDGIFLHGFRQGKGLLNRIGSFSRLKKSIEEVKPDCMFCHEPDALMVAYRYYRKEKKRRNTKLFFDCHEAYEHWFDNITPIKTINRIAGVILMRIINYTVSRIDGVTSVNNTMTERFKKYNSNSYFLPSVYKIDNSDDYIENGSTEVVYMGQFGNSKQKEMLLKAAKILKEKGILVKVTIIGGEKRSDINADSFESIVQKEHLEEYFDIKGWMPAEEAFNLLPKYGVGMMRFDSYTMPGNYAMPNKLFEYMAYGLAILSCKLNLEIKQIIEENQCGILLEKEDGEDLANALLYIKEHTHNIIQMKYNSFRVTAEKYNWDSYKSLLRQLVEGNP